MPNSQLFADHFSKALDSVSGAFPHLPALTDAQWAELHGLEDVINALWLADEATFNEFREVVAGYKMWWFKKKAAEAILNA